MKRDMDLVRRILLEVEADEHSLTLHQLEIKGYSREQVGYHVYLMDQAGLLRTGVSARRRSASPEGVPLRLTWEGHEFLEAARDPARWKAALKVLHDKGAAVTFGALKWILVDLSRRALSG